ncbi:MAG: hypothetical protein U0168_14265 [Nannocystaceae bacterium]
MVIAGSGKLPAFASDDLRAFASSPAGDIVAAAAVRDGVVMVHYDGTRTRRMPLPPAAGVVQIRGVVFVARDHVYAYGDLDDDSAGYLARFDGSAWHELEGLPCSSAIVSASVDRDGDLWATCGVAQGRGSSALLRWRDGTLEELGLPTAADEGPVAVLASAPDDVWVVTGSWLGGGDTLWHSGGPAAPVALPSLAQTNDAAREWAEPAPLRRDCLEAWLPLRPGADRAAVRARLDAAAETELPILAARVQGEVQWGLRIDPNPVRLRTIASHLGEDAGKISCNERPIVEPPAD